MTVDPEFKQYPFISPFSAFANNPEYYIDPGGETLRVAGDVKAREEARVHLQKLTNDKVIVQADGLVKVVAGNQNPSKKLVHGTQLIKDVISNKHTATIEVRPNSESYQTETDEKTKANATNGVGTDVTIVLGHDKMLFEVDKKTGKTVKGMIGKALILGHELIHGLKGMDGTQKPLAVKEGHEYKDESGKTVTETQPVEELETTGLGGHRNTWKAQSKETYSSENDLRKEQGRNQRAAYDKP